MRYHYPTLEQFASDTVKQLMKESGRGEQTCKLALYYCDQDYEMALKITLTYSQEEARREALRQKILNLLR